MLEHKPKSRPLSAMVDADIYDGLKLYAQRTSTTSSALVNKLLRKMVPKLLSSLPGGGAAAADAEELAALYVRKHEAEKRLKDIYKPWNALRKLAKVNGFRDSVKLDALGVDVGIASSALAEANAALEDYYARRVLPS